MKRADPIDWQAMRAEAQILYERLSQGPSNDPVEDERLIARAAELQALGFEARATYAATSGKPRH